MITPLNGVTNGDWICAVCGKSPPKVVQTDHLPIHYYCADCLWNAVQSGALVVIPARSDALTPASAEQTSVSLPITTHDDGSLTIGEVEIKWD